MSDFTLEIERCIPSLRRYATALLHDREAADDLVQDCLERALRKRLLWRRGSSMRAWLFTILHNLYVNGVRRNSRMPSMIAEENAAVSYQEPHQADTLMGDIVDCIDQLPNTQRQVLLLVALEGFSYKEVGRIVGVPVGTVMSRLSRARENLRRLMEGESRPGLRRVK